jgi:hypothetical protein
LEKIGKEGGRKEENKIGKQENIYLITHPYRFLVGPERVKKFPVSSKEGPVFKYLNLMKLFTDESDIFNKYQRGRRGLFHTDFPVTFKEYDSSGSSVKMILES